MAGSSWPTYPQNLAPSALAWYQPRYSSQLSAGSAHSTPLVPHQCWRPAILIVLFMGPDTLVALAAAGRTGAADTDARPDAKTNGAAIMAAAKLTPRARLMASPSKPGRTKPFSYTASGEARQ